MTEQKSVSIRIDIKKPSSSEYQATIRVRAGKKQEWLEVARGKNPLDALDSAKRKIDRDLSPSKRGRKPLGYWESLLMLAYGWQEPKK